MPDLANRAAAAGLVLAGLATLAVAWSLPGAESGLDALYVQLLTGAVGVALLLAAGVPVVRLPAISAGLLAKLGFIATWLAVGGAGLPGWQPAFEFALAILLGACGAIFLLDARRQARWNGVPSLRMEV